MIKKKCIRAMTLKTRLASRVSPASDAGAKAEAE